MAIDASFLAAPLTPLTTSSPITAGINALVQGTEVKRQRERQVATDQRVEKQATRQGQLTDLQIQNIQNNIAIKGKIQSVKDYGSFLVRVNERVKSGDFAGARSLSVDRVGSLNEQSKTDPSVNPDNTIQIRQLLETDPTAAAKLIDSELSWATQIGAIGVKKVQSGPKAGAAITLINPDTKEKILVSPIVDPNTKETILSPFDIPEGFEISTETTEEKRSADVIANLDKVTNKLDAERRSKPITEGLIETEKLKAKLQLKPKIETAVTEARSAAQERGEAFTDLARSQAALPGLLEAVGELKELALIATSTIGGKIFDAAVKETGFGATEGATAKAKFIAIVNNQVLPLLKPTFGGSFSVQEGESLKATMGDPEATPAEKIVQLEAFIEQKIRTIETKQRQLSQSTQTLTLDEQRELEQLRADQQ